MDEIFGPFGRFFSYLKIKVSKKAKIRNRYNQVPHLTHDTTWESDKNTRKLIPSKALWLYACKLNIVICKSNTVVFNCALGVQVNIFSSIVIQLLTGKEC